MQQKSVSNGKERWGRWGKEIVSHPEARFLKV